MVFYTGKLPKINYLLVYIMSFIVFLYDISLNDQLDNVYTLKNIVFYMLFSHKTQHSVVLF